LKLRHAAVEQELAAGRERGIKRQEERGTGKLFGRADALQRSDPFAFFDDRGAFGLRRVEAIVSVFTKPGLIALTRSFSRPAVRAVLEQ